MRRRFTASAAGNLDIDHNPHVEQGVRPSSSIIVIITIW